MQLFYTFIHKKVLQILVVGILLFSSVFCFFKEVKTVGANTHSKQITVVIDAGHGGIDAGVTGKKTKVKESDLNLSIAKKLKAEFEAGGIKVVMTRNSYGGLYGTTAKGFKMRDMKKRIKIINGANASAMISIHLNYYSDTSRRGATVFFKDKAKEGKRLAENIQNYLNTCSFATRKFSPLKGDYYLLNESSCPAVICECGFLSNPEEELLLQDENCQNELARLIYLGTISFLLE